MKTFYKMLIAGVLSFTMLTAVAQPRHPQGQPCPDAVAGATMPAEPHHGQPHEGCMMPCGGGQAVDFQSVKICYLPEKSAFVAIDSVECSVHLIAMQDGKLDTVAHF